MKRLIGCAIVLVILVAVTSTVGWASDDDHDPISMGKPLSYWLKSIRDLDSQSLSAAFDAIGALGPEAWPAVPELTQVVAEPFMPINVGVDDSEVIVSKLFSIQLRAHAIKALAAIGKAAAPSAVPLMNWALTLRVIAGPIANQEEETLFVDLVIIDVIQRMRVAGAIVAFGTDAYPAVATLLRSPDGESRKLAVAILGQDSPLVASALVKSQTCEERKLGILMLIDTWPVVAKEHLNALRSMLACNETN